MRIGVNLLFLYEITGIGVYAKNILEKWFEFTAKLSDTCFSAFVLNGSTLNILVTNFGEHNSTLETNLKELAQHTDEFRSVAPIELSKKLKNY